jgi:two-component system, cell cycle sensor histidine kinase and response regulator CckA
MVPSAAESVLVVDDEPMVRALVQDILSSEGYPVLDAGSPWEALGIAAKHPISVLLTDIAMPKMNGYEMAMRIESVRPEAKVLFMSAHAEHGMLIPKPHFIAKPFTVDGILQAVSEVLGPTRRPGTPSGSPETSPATSPDSRM